MRRWLVVFSVGIALLIASPSAAASSWTIEPSANPSGATYSNLYAISCPGANDCTAVGTYEATPGLALTLAEHWDGATWSVESTPNPSGGTNNALYGVSCTSASDCMAVGGYTDSSGSDVQLTEHWDGTSWTIQSTPSVVPIRNWLLGVSCPSAGDCTAVGTANFETLAEHWDGTSWTVQTSPNPSGRSAQLEGVSCTSASDCTAGGGIFPPKSIYLPVVGGVVVPPDGTVAEHWNGSSWAIQQTPASSGNGTFTGVSCTPALFQSACTAVGYSGTGPLAERRSGNAWTIQATQGPGEFDAVSCWSSSACTAVGDSSQWQPLAEGWSGLTWSVEPTPAPAHSTLALLNGVSCTSASTCTAVGSYKDSAGQTVTLAESYS